MSSPLQEHAEAAADPAGIAASDPVYPPVELGRPLPDYVAGLQALAEAEIEGFIPPAGTLFHDIFRYVFEGPATRSRPILVYATGDMYGIPRAKLNTFAGVTEMSHTSSLVFDDIHDGSPERRGKPAAHVRFGADVAMLGALAILFKAERRLAEVDAREGLRGSLATYVNDMLGEDGMCLGQAEDMQSFGQEPSQANVKKLERIAHKKTGMAIEMSVLGAAIIGGLPSEDRFHLRQYAYHAGIAYQINNDFGDVLPVDGSSNGAPNQDAANGKPNYVSVLGSDAAAEELHRHAEQGKTALDRLPAGLNPVKLKELTEALTSSVARPA